jgi:hypothetical protein
MMKKVLFFLLIAVIIFGCTNQPKKIIYITEEVFEVELAGTPAPVPSIVSMASTTPESPMPLPSTSPEAATSQQASSPPSPLINSVCDCNLQQHWEN